MLNLLDYEKRNYLKKNHKVTVSGKMFWIQEGTFRFIVALGTQLCN